MRHLLCGFDLIGLVTEYYSIARDLLRQEAVLIHITRKCSIVCSTVAFDNEDTHILPGVQLPEFEIIQITDTTCPTIMVAIEQLKLWQKEFNKEVEKIIDLLGVKAWQLSELSAQFNFINTF